MMDRLLRVCPALVVLLALPAQGLASSVTYTLLEMDLACDCDPLPSQVPGSDDLVDQFLSVGGSLTTDGTIGPLSLDNLIGVEFLAVQYGEDDPGLGFVAAEIDWTADSGTPAPFGVFVDVPGAVTLSATEEALTLSFLEGSVAGDAFSIFSPSGSFSFARGSILGQFLSDITPPFESELTQDTSLQIGTLADTNGPPPGVIPLPAAGWLLLGGLGALAALRRPRGA